MPRADNDTAKSQAYSTTQSLPPPSLPRQWFRTPAPIRRLFDTFPLQTLAPNPLPVRSPSDRSKPTLYVFSTPQDALTGEPSFNPGCLKWQTYLLMSSLKFSTMSSNNHASPSGALPFLLPASTPNNENPLPFPAGKLQKWLADQKLARLEPDSMRYEAYMSLLDHRIRRAWLYNLYLTPNHAAVAHPLYIHPCTRSILVRTALSYQLQLAAKSELLKTCRVIDPETLYVEAEEALEALSTLLGEEEWFFGAEYPGLFDASVFAYTHLLLDEELGWVDGRLAWQLKERGNLVRHRRRVYRRCYGGAPVDNGKL